MENAVTAEECTHHEKTEVDSIVEELSQHPFFVDKIDDDATELPPFIEAIRQIKWDEEEPPEVRAEKFKEEGNFNVKLRKYRRAVISYTVGIELSPSDNELLSKLYHNRAVANIQLGNMRRAVEDLKAAINLNGEYVKAYEKATNCLNKLERFDDCVQLCLKGLRRFKGNSTLISQLQTAKQGKEALERKERAEVRKKLESENKAALLREVIKNLGIRLELADNEELFDLVELSEMELSWRVCFVEMDSGHRNTILRVPSTLTFNEQLLFMTGEGNDGTPDLAKNTKIFGKSEGAEMISLDWDQSLLDYLTDKRVVIDNPILEFHLFPK